MKSLTIHRAGLSKERMSMFDEVKPNNLEKDEMPQYNIANNKVEEKTEDNKELDVLYKGIGRNFVRQTSNNKTPIVYFTVGFIAGALFILMVIGIVALSSRGSSNIEEVEIKTTPASTSVTVEEKKTNEETVTGDVEAQEKYEIQAGDTLDKIVVKYYGEYSDSKIQEIQNINNIKDPSKLQIGQIIVLPAK